VAQWFGSSGIRGSFESINPEFSMNLGVTVGKTLKMRNTSYIASDIRFTSGLLKSAFMSGFSSVSGVKIVDVGLIPTPVLSYISAVENTLGVMVTASHNPPSNNGFKFFLDGSECGENFEQKVEKELQIELESSRITTKYLNPWNKTGEIEYRKNIDLIDDYIKFLLKKVSIAKFERKIILDCANNVPNLVSPRVLKKVGFNDLITINNVLDAEFPGRLSEPSSGNLGTLKRRVIEEGADIGIAHDGDGDRFAIIDENGIFVNSTALICFFLDYLDYNQPNKRKVVLTSDCTKQATEIAKRKGATVIESRIGRNRDYAHDKEVLFLAEPNKLIFPDLGKWIEGLYPVLKLLEVLNLQESNKVSELIQPYDKRKVLRKAFQIFNDDRDLIDDLITNLPQRWSEKITTISSLDGLKLNLKDDSSILIRFSGTEPKVKFYIESSNVQKNDQILNQIISEFKFETKAIDC
jgi:phosphoglucosamine mutase